MKRIFASKSLQAAALAFGAVLSLALPVGAHDGHDHSPAGGISHGGIFVEGSPLTLAIPGEVDETAPVAWYKNGVHIAGETTRYLEFHHLELSDSGHYTADYINPSHGHKHGPASFGPVGITVVGASEAPVAGVAGLTALGLVFAGGAVWRLRARRA